MPSVRTTVDLPDELLIAAKKRAAEDRTSLRELLARSLRRELALGSGPASRSRRPPEFDWVVVRGGLPPGLDVSRRAAMYEWLDRDDVPTRGSE